MTVKYESRWLLAFECRACDQMTTVEDYLNGQNGVVKVEALSKCRPFCLPQASDMFKSSVACF